MEKRRILEVAYVAFKTDFYVTWLVVLFCERGGRMKLLEMELHVGLYKEK